MLRQIARAFAAKTANFVEKSLYHQRTLYNTDLAFVRRIRNLKNVPVAIADELLVIGHSLDITDEDVEMI